MTWFSSQRFRVAALAVLLAAKCCGAVSMDAPKAGCLDQGVSAREVEIQGSVPAVVSFQSIANAIIIHVRLNGKGPFAMLLDSGAVDFISPEVAEELGLAVKEGYQGVGIGARTVESGATSIKCVQIGNVTLHDPTFHVVPLPYVMEHGFPEKLAGGMGYELFRRMVIHVNFERGELSLWDNQTFRYRGRGKAVPFVLRGHVPVVNGSVDGMPGVFEIDTGAEDSLSLNAPFVKQNDVIAKYSAVLYGFAGEGIGGRENAYFVRAHTFDLGGSQVHSIVTELSQDTAGAAASSDVAGIVGVGVLKRFDITFDYAEGKLYLEKNANYPRPGVFNRAGFSPRITAEGIKVVSVFQDSPASQAGIAPGDLILAINHHASSEVDGRFLYNLLRQKPGTSVRLTILHVGIEKNVEIKLRDLL